MTDEEQETLKRLRVEIAELRENAHWLSMRDEERVIKIEELTEQRDKLRAEIERLEELVAAQKGWLLDKSEEIESLMISHRGMHKQFERMRQILEKKREELSAAQGPSQSLVDSVVRNARLLIVAGLKEEMFPETSDHADVRAAKALEQFLEEPCECHERANNPDDAKWCRHCGGDLKGHGQ